MEEHRIRKARNLRTGEEFDITSIDPLQTMREVAEELRRIARFLINEAPPSSIPDRIEELADRLDPQDG